MSSSSTPLSTPEGPGSVSGAPNLPAGFTDTFASRYINTDGLRREAPRPGAELIAGHCGPLRADRPRGACREASSVARESAGIRSSDHQERKEHKPESDEHNHAHQRALPRQKDRHSAQMPLLAPGA